MDGDVLYGKISEDSGHDEVMDHLHLLDLSYIPIAIDPAQLLD
jgi:hypothetical protein